MSRLTHVGSEGNVQMVDVSGKPLSAREAIAAGTIQLQAKTIELISQDQIAKGNVLATARIAAIQAAKQTSQLIPLCHNLSLSDVRVDIELATESAEVRCTAKTVAETGVEMEALTGVAVGLLTIYDMCKAVDKQMRITDIYLVKKTKAEVSS